MYTFLLYLGLAQCSVLWGQQGYFQQQVHYRIEASLDDSNHILSGVEYLEYFNQSPDTLREIYFHFYINAYKNRNTAFAKQMRSNGKTHFEFAESEQLGRYKDPVFLDSGDSLRWKFHPEHPDVVKVQLLRPLAPGNVLKLEIPFKYRIPYLFSRGGHVGQNYQFTQWYPKPAVYDARGWHYMPYLENGEFYGEFGSFDVSLTLPQSYVVASTGELVTDSEKQFLAGIISQTEQALKNNHWSRAIDSSGTEPRKTIRFIAENVHDFAWGADKGYFVRKGQARLQGGRIVDTYVYFLAAEAQYWAPAIEYVTRAVTSYSAWIGDYAYPQATAVQSVLRNNGGMEYPMLTFISPERDSADLDLVITHEVGHNWFYGMLGSNERDHAWMDEGLNSYFEDRYTRQFHSKAPSGFNQKMLTLGQTVSTDRLAWDFQDAEGLTRPVDSPSGEMTQVNYFLNAYSQPKLALQLLERRIGRARMDRLMQLYFSSWKFKHPYPDDFRRIAEAVSEEKLDWMFEDWFEGNAQSGYSIRAVEREAKGQHRLQLRNSGKLPAPLQIQAWRKDGSLAYDETLAGFGQDTVILVPAGDYTLIQLDAAGLLPQRKRECMRWEMDPKGDWSRDVQWKLRPLTGVGLPDTRSIYFLPALAYNTYDGFQLGAVLHNADLPGSRFQYALAPMYGFASGQLTGAASLSWKWFMRRSSNAFLEIGLGARRFAFDENDKFDYTLTYHKLAPVLRYRFRHPDVSPWRAELSYRPLMFWRETADFEQMDSVTMYREGPVQKNLVHEWAATFQRKSVINPLFLQVRLEQQRYDNIVDESNRYLKLTAEYKGDYTFAPRKALSLRIFAGTFLQNSQKDATNYNDGFVQGSFSVFGRGKDDYLLEYWYMGRSEAEGLLSAQVNPELQGGSRQAISSSFSDGQSNRFMVALNLKADLPQLPSYLPIKPYFDAAVIGVDTPKGDKQDLFWSGGAMLEYFDGLFSVHFPIVRSRQYEYLDAQTRRGSYWSRISFQLALHRLDVFKFRSSIPQQFF